MITIPVYIILALAAAFFFSLTGILAKLSSKYAIKNPHALLFYLYPAGLLFLPIIPALSKLQNPLPAFPPLLLFSSAFFIASVFLYIALFSLDASVFQPFFHFQTIFTATFAYLFLGETFKSSTYAWIAVIIVGGILVGVDEKLKLKALLQKPFFLLMTSFVFFALSDILAKKTLIFLDFWNLRFWSSALLAVMGLSLLPLGRGHLKVSPRQLLPVFGIAFFGFLASLLLFKAYTFNVTLSQAFGMFGSLFTLIIAVILSRFRPGFLEYHPPKIYLLRAFGVSLMLFASIMITLGR